MTFPRPFKENYGLTLTLAILAIGPYILLTTGYQMYETHLTADLRTSRMALSIISGLGVAGYAFGAFWAASALRSGGFLERVNGSSLPAPYLARARTVFSNTAQARFSPDWQRACCW